MRSQRLALLRTGAPVANVTYLNSNFNETDLTTYTFSAVNFGFPAADRHVVAAVWAGAVSARTITSVTIGGVTATAVGTLATATGTSVIFGRLFIAAVPTGDTGDIVVVWSGAMQRTGAHVFRLIGLNSITPTDTAQDVTMVSGVVSTNTLDVTAGGCAICLCYESITAGAWSSLAGISNGIVLGDRMLGFDNFASAQTDLTLTGTHSEATGAAGIMAAAAWR